MAEKRSRAAWMPQEGSNSRSPDGERLGGKEGLTKDSNRQNNWVG